MPAVRMVVSSVEGRLRSSAITASQFSSNVSTAVCRHSSLLFPPQVPFRYASPACPRSLMPMLKVMTSAELRVRRIDVSLRRACSSRSEEHTSELQSRQYLVCRLLLEKKKKTQTTTYTY